MIGRLRPTAVALLAAVLVISGAWLTWNASQRRGGVQAGQDAAQAARDSIVAMMSYQPATAQQSLTAAAADRLTGEFLAEYTQLITTVVVPEAVGKRITATATVPAAAVVSADTRHAVVLAYVDQTTAVGSGPPNQTNSAVRVTMDNVDRRWLISGFDPI